MRKEKIRSWLCLIVTAGTIILLNTCGKEHISYREYPRIRTMEAESRAEGGVIFRAEVLFQQDVNISEYGFVWDTCQNPSLENSERRSMTELINGDVFSATVNTTIERNQEYFVRAYVKSDNYLVYGSNISFMGQGSSSAIITALIPEVGYWGDTISILGEHFSNQNNTVLFESVEAKVISNSDTVISVLVPSCLSEQYSKVTVKIAGYSTQTPLDFQLLPTKITSFHPNSGSENDIIEIYGEGFKKLDIEVSLGNETVASIIEVTPKTIKVRLPSEVIESGAKPIRIFNGCNTIKSSSDFLLDGFQIEEISEQSGIIGISVVKALGSNFSLQPDDYKLVVDNTVIEVYMKELTESQVSFYLPGTIKSGNHQISLEVGGKTFVQTFDFEFISPWSRKSNLPSDLFGSYGSTFVLRDNIYFANGYRSGDNDFWTYHPSRDTWERKSDIPGPAYSNRCAFTINGIGYIGTGKYYSSYSTSCDFYSYDPNTDSWQAIGFMDTLKINNGYIGSIGFANEEKGFLFAGDGEGSGFTNSKYWEFNPETGKWRTIDSFDEFNDFNFLMDPVGFTIDGKFYMGMGKIWTDEYNTRFWEYNPATNQWKEIQEFPGIPRGGAIGFSLDGVGYIGLGKNRTSRTLCDFWVYDPETDQWRATSEFPGSPREGAVSAVVGNRAYVGLSGSENDLWEFNPKIH